MSCTARMLILSLMDKWSYVLLAPALYTHFSVNIFHRLDTVLISGNHKRILRLLLSFLLIRVRSIHYSEKHQTCLNYRNITMFNYYLLLWTPTFYIRLGLLFHILLFYQSDKWYWDCNVICNLNSNTSKMLSWQGRLNGRHNSDIFFYWNDFWVYYGKRPYTNRMLLCSFFYLHASLRLCFHG